MGLLTHGSLRAPEGPARGSLVAQWLELGSEARRPTLIHLNRSHALVSKDPPGVFRG